jgi:hypothetical protein
MASLKERYEAAMKKPKDKRSLQEMEFIADYEGYAFKAKKEKDDGLFSGVKKKLIDFVKGKKRTPEGKRQTYTPQKNMSPSEYKKYLKKLQQTGKAKPMFKES